jgi:sec-independent protein translocase protein TatC
MVRNANHQSQAKPNKSSNDSPKLTFLEHLYELRKRLFWIILTLVFTTAIGLEIKDQLIEIVMAPLKGGKLVYLTPGGGFSFIFTLSLYFGVLLTIPVITYQIYKFLQPMLQQNSRKFIFGFIVTSVVLATLGASLAYFLAIPGSLGFLDGVAGTKIIPNLTADSYLTFVTTYMVGLAALFQLPLLLFLYDHARPIPPGFLAKSQRYGIVATTIFAGLITPSPDLLNYSIVLFPILASYEFGVLAVYLRRKFFRMSASNLKSKNPVAKTIPETEPLNDEMPLTSIIEELAEENGQHPEPVDIQPVVEAKVEPEPEPVKQEPTPAVQQPSHADYDAEAQANYAQQVYQQQLYAQQQYAQQQAYYYAQQQAAAKAQLAAEQQAAANAAAAAAQDAANRGRSMEGVRVSDRYKTNVKVPRRNGEADPATATGQQSSDQSTDSLLTAQA